MNLESEGIAAAAVEAETTSKSSEVSETSEFPYTGIFGPNGFLSSFSSDEKEDGIDKVKEVEEGQSLSCKSSEKDDKDKGDWSDSLESSCRNGNLQQQLLFSKEDLPPHEIALNFDHILEQIFRSLKTKDLLKCRRISRHWNSIATQELQKQIHIKFVDYNLNWSDSGKSLIEFTSLLQQTEKFSLQFPSNKFSFTSTYRSSRAFLSDEILQEFLNNFGPTIHELTLSFFSNKMDSSTSGCVPTEKFAIYYIKNLLTNQAPNLRQLSLRMATKIDWKASTTDSFFRSISSPLRTTDPEFEEIHNTTFNKKLNRNLTVLNLPAYISAKVLETIIVLCPNLHEICPYEHGYMYLLEPFDLRLKYLKKLCINPDPVEPELTAVCIGKLELLASTMATQKGCCQLEEITINVGHRHRKLQMEHQQLFLPDIETRVIRIINQILDSNWDSLQIITWNGLIFHPELRWPQVLPNVWKLKLGTPINSRAGTSQNVFPKGFRLQDTFPKLRSVILEDSYKQQRENFVDFANCLEFEPVPSVKTVYLVDWNWYVDLTLDSVVGKPVLPGCLEGITRLFPRATISVVTTV